MQSRSPRKSKDSWTVHNIVEKKRMKWWKSWVRSRKLLEALLLRARRMRYYLKLETRWRDGKSCQELYNYKTENEEQLLKELKTQVAPSERAPVVLFSEVESAVYCVKNIKAPRIDNISRELLKYGGSSVINILSICNKILEKGRWPEKWTKSIILILVPKNPVWNNKTIAR